MSAGAPGLWGWRLLRTDTDGKKDHSGKADLRRERWDGLFPGEENGKYYYGNAQNGYVTKTLDQQRRDADEAAIQAQADREQADIQSQIEAYPRHAVRAGPLPRGASGAGGGDVCCGCQPGGLSGTGILHFRVPAGNELPSGHLADAAAGAVFPVCLRPGGRGHRPAHGQRPCGHGAVCVEPPGRLGGQAADAVVRGAGRCSSRRRSTWRRRPSAAPFIRSI